MTGARQADALAEFLEPQDRRRCLQRRYQLKSLTARHRRIMLMELQGLSVRRICAAVGMSRSQIGAIINSVLYRHERDRLLHQLESAALAEQGAVRRRLDALAGPSLQQLENILDDPEAPARLRVQVAWDVLDRARVQAVEQRDVTVDFARAAVAAFERRKALRAAQQAAGEAGPIPTLAGPADGPPGVPERVPGT